MTLRKSLIRLAHAHPELRADLLPLLKQAAPPYDVSVDHGYEEPLAGGTNVMQQLQNRLLVEQGSKPHDPNHRLAANTADQLYRERALDIKEILSKIEDLLKQHAKAQEKKDLDWGYPGDLGRVVELLLEVKTFLTPGPGGNIRAAANKPELLGFRTPYYSAGDGLQGLEDAVTSPLFMDVFNDLTLQRRIQQAQAALTQVYRHLEANYRWD